MGLVYGKINLCGVGREKKIICEQKGEGRRRHQRLRRPQQMFLVRSSFPQEKRRRLGSAQHEHASRKREARSKRRVQQVKTSALPTRNMENKLYEFTICLHCNAGIKKKKADITENQEREAISAQVLLLRVRCQRVMPRTRVQHVLKKKTFTFTYVCRHAVLQMSACQKAVFYNLPFIAF